MGIKDEDTWTDITCGTNVTYCKNITGGTSTIYGGLKIEKSVLQNKYCTNFSNCSPSLLDLDVSN